MTDEQRQRMRNIEARAEPLFRELTHVEEQIRYYRQCLFDAQDEKKKIEARIAPLNDEKSNLWTEIFSTTED